MGRVALLLKFHYPDLFYFHGLLDKFILLPNQNYS
jgi:hypothetical protein